MNPRRILTAATATAVVAGGALAPIGSAADDAAPALKLKGAYAYVDSIPAAKQKFVKVVFRTSSALPRRFDGSIQAGVSIEGVNHSIASAKRGSRCYTGLAEIKGGSIATLKNDEVVRKGAKIGRSFTVKVFTRDGQSVTRKLTLRAERKGDDSGKPLGC